MLQSTSYVKTITTQTPIVSGGGGLCVYSNNIYLATDTGVEVYSLGNPSSPSYSTTLPVPGGIYDVHVFDGNAYVEGPSASPTVQIRSLSNWGTIANCYEYTDNNVPYAIQFYGGKVYLADTGGIKELALGSGSITISLDANIETSQTFGFDGDLGSFILDDNSDATYSSTKTFSSMQPGNYIVHQIVPTGWALTGITATGASQIQFSSDGNTWNSTFTSGDSYAKVAVQSGSSPTVTFSDSKLAAISGHVIYDLDGSGTRNDLESYVADGWKLELYKDGVKTKETTTSSGAYSFSVLASGSYEVRSILPTGWSNTLPANGRRTYTPLSTDQTNQDFGARGSFSISGIVFRDINGDGAKNGLDAPVSAKTVQLFNTTSNSAIAQCTSGADGSYTFSNIAPGSYSIRAVATSGWQTTNSPITLTSLTGSISNQNLGLKGTLAISGIKFQDKNGNGQRDTGEAPLSGWTIFNDSNQDGALQSGEISDVTDSQGIYNITNLIPGSNRIVEVAQSGWTETVPAAGYYDVTLTNANVAGKNFGNIPSLTVAKATNPAGSTESFAFRDTVSSGDSFLLTDQQTKTFSAAAGTYTLTEDAIAGWKLIDIAVSGTASAKYGSGSSFAHDAFTAGDTGVQVTLDANEYCILTFNNSKIYTISGLVWDDLDYDGLQDSGEPALSGVSVELLDQNAGSFSPARTNSTNAEGMYSFTVTSGSYRVKFTLPSGRYFSPADHGSDDSLDSDATPASGQTAVITLASGASSSVQDAGMYENRIVINEIYPNPVGSDNTAGNYSTWERVELKNTGSHECSIGGWMIKDDDSPYILATVPSGTTIAAGEYLVLHIGGSSQGISNSNGDPVNLTDSAGILLDSVSCPASSSFEGLSYSCLPDATENWGFWGEPTLGGDLSSLSLPGAVNMGLDWGDAPDTYSTTRSQNGPRHFVTGPHLGSKIDYETNGLPGVNANGDDISGEDDEDGATFSNEIIVGLPSSFNVTASASGILQAWIDFNGDGDFADSGEQIATDVALTSGENTISLAAPADAKAGYTYARLRFSSASGLSYTGLASDGEVEDYRIEIKEQYVLGDLVWEDLDADGLQDANEPGLDGVTVNLRDGADSIVAFNTTSGGGHYSFVNPSPGTYTLEFVPPAGYNFTEANIGSNDAIDSDANPDTHRTTATTVVLGQSNLTLDAGLYRTASISGIKFNDRNESGVRDTGEPVLSGWTIYLDLDRDGQWDNVSISGSAIEPSRVTDSSGAYSFSGLIPGSYRVAEVMQNSWIQSCPAGSFYDESIVSGQTASDLDFGNHVVSGLSISGKKMNETGAARKGWNITLTGNTLDGYAVSLNATTADDGSYSFTGLLAGSYTVSEETKAGWQAVGPSSYSFDLTASKTDIDFVNQIVSGLSVSGKKTNQTGAGKRDWNITLTGNTLDGSAVSLRAITASDGSYSFTGLLAGSYTVAEETKAGWQAVGASSYSFEITSSKTDVDFVNQIVSGLSISGRKTNETGVTKKGWNITLIGTTFEGASVSERATTADDGSYSFAGLFAGSYTISEETKVGWKAVGPSSYSFDLTASKSDVNFVNQIVSGLSVSGRKTNQTGAGKRDWNITITGTTLEGSAVSLRTTTAIDGSYSFNGLFAGSYTVAEEARDGWESVGPSSYGFDLTASKTDVDFVNQVLTGCSITGKKINETGAVKKGWNITLTGLTSDGSAVSLKATTADDGSFSFTGLFAGDYTLAEELKAGWQSVDPASYNIHLGSSIKTIDVTFRNHLISGLSVSGRKTNETGVAKKGWNITLTGTTFEGTAVSLKTSTAFDGSYSFTDLSAGSYTVAEEARDGWQPLGPPGYNFDLIASKTDLDFVNRIHSGLSISGMKTNQTGAGKRDWNIALTGTTFEGGAVSMRTTTASDGSYSFTGLFSGSYTVAEEAKDGWESVGPSSFSFDLTASKSDVNFVNRPASGLVITGRKTNETGVAKKGWNITLTGITLDDTAVSLKAMTADDGSYSFTDLSAGSYTIAEEVRDGWQSVSPASYSIIYKSGSLNLDFVNRIISGLAISGHVVTDKAAPKSGWNITLTGMTLDGDPVSLNTATASDGSYSFTGLLAGDYKVTCESRAQWPVIDPATGYYDVSLRNADSTDKDFEIILSSSISGSKFEDKDGDGIWDTGDPGLGGWTIRLQRSGWTDNTTITSADGNYSFEDLPEGSYILSEVEQDDWDQTAPKSGTHSVDLIDASVSGINFGNRRNVTGMTVDLTASPDTALQGGSVILTTTINSTGSIRPDSLSAEQLLPSGLAYISATPQPDSTTANPDGTTTIIWSDLPTASSPSDTLATMAVQTTVNPDASGLLSSNVSVSAVSSQAIIKNAFASTKITVKDQLLPVTITKTSDLDEVAQGSYVTYTIGYESNVEIDLTGVVITEHAPSDLEFISASPAPDGGTESVWTLNTLDGRTSGEISILYQVKNRANVSYESTSQVAGEGYVNVRRSLSTETNNRITNSVTLSCNEFAPVSTSHSIKLLDAEGTTLLEKEHGSGEYRTEEMMSLKMQNRSIRTEGSLKASYRPTSFALPGGRSLEYDSLQYAGATTKNRATSATTGQSFGYAKSIDLDRKLLLDKNETDLAIEANVQGQSHLSALKKEGPNSESVFESSADNRGTFSINSSLEDYGRSVRMTGNTTGTGSAENDLRLKKSQRSYEHGSGTYQQEELASTPESYIAKEVNASYNGSMSAAYGNSYGKWTSGMWSKSSGNSFVGQEISGADYIKEETLAGGLSDMETNASFRGQGRFRAVSEPDNRSQTILDDTYVGEYSISRKVHLGGISHFDRPHITLIKEGRPVEKTSRVDYHITVLNDGNAALGPVYVWDPFPAGTDYVSASIKPTVLKADSVNWTLLYLGIGQIIEIDLQLNITDPGDALVNRVYALGGHNSEWVFASNMSALQVGWLACCPKALLAEMQARVDSTDAKVVWYRIYLHNPGNVSMAAQVTAALPRGLSFLNASVEPQQFNESLNWVTDVILPGDSQIIEYRAMAMNDGRFVSTATVESHPLDGSEGDSSQVSASITVGNETSASYPEDGWKPPEWGLDRSDIFDSLFNLVAGDGDDSSACESGSCPV